ncbi:MAG: hypothetical protein EA377_03975 [Phycisphaerales bacterium]|nr:MAG: hypothetical protein EA377_03975 [Phycisphaerales bacterium]
MKILIDMNLSPKWCEVFEREGWQATHWSAVGSHNATDRDIMEWATTRQHVVFTHDLDFGAMLAATQAVSPSVIQVRTRDPLPDRLGSMVIAVIREHADALREGALIIVDEARSRIRILPLAD